MKLSIGIDHANLGVIQLEREVMLNVAERAEEKVESELLDMVRQITAAINARKGTL